MNTASELSDAILKAFEPPDSGFVGIVDNLLQLCRGGELEIAWRSNVCHVCVRHGTVEESLDVPLRKSVFRAILARIAALCNQHQQGSLSPYGGNGVIHLGPHSVSVFSAKFINTTAEQSAQLAHLSENSVSADAQHVGSGDVGSSAALPPAP